MAIHPKSLANLKPVKVGEVRNPFGAPRKLPEIDSLLAEVLGSDNPDSSQAKAILEALLKEAVKGNVRAAEILLDRAYGKAKQSIELSKQVTAIRVIRE